MIKHFKKMNAKINILFLFLVGLSISSCESFIAPDDDNKITEEILINDPGAAEGILLKAYASLPDEHNFSLESVTDDAVTNDFSSVFWKMANGQYSAYNNPNSQWSMAYTNIFYINKFLEIVDEVPWDLDSEEISALHNKRLRGEAYGLRAWYEFKLLRGHSGLSETGELLGYPVVRETIEITDDWQIPRSSFEECVDYILEDCDSALAYLPDVYSNIPDNNVFNSTMGARFTNRINGNAIKALVSRLLLYSASPAFNIDGDQAKWEAAAEYTGDFLQENGGLTALSDNGLSFWIYPAGGPYDPDIIWATSIVQNNRLEQKHFPPSLFGNAEINPSQNLVDAFPMVNGYPITDDNSSFIPTFPYRDRDPRLEAFILYDNGMIGSKGPIRTYVNAAPDGIGEQSNSTRTGYYAKKFLNPGAVISPIPANANHFYTHIRFTEVFLNYAEAANEAWGPDGAGTSGISARDVIAAIRNRAGILAPDSYLESVTDKQEFRELIRNERRIELCFEGHRFYDIRRWKEIDVMKSPVTGVSITQGFPAKYEYKVIENRDFKDHMIYGPIPYNEALKYDELLQNSGW